MIDNICKWYAELGTTEKVVIGLVGVPLGALGGIVAAPVIGAAVSGAGFGVLGGYLWGAAASELST